MAKHLDPRGDANAPDTRSQYDGKHRAEDRQDGFRAGNQDPSRRGLEHVDDYSRE